MGAGGGNWEGARAELLRPGFKAGGEDMGIGLSAEICAGLGTGAGTDGAGFDAAAAGNCLVWVIGLTDAEAFVVLTGVVDFSAAMDDALTAAARIAVFAGVLAAFLIVVSDFAALLPRWTAAATATASFVLAAALVAAI